MRRNDSAQRESHSVTQLRTGRATRLGSRGVAGGAGCASCAPRRTELSGARKVSEREQTGKPAVFDYERAPNSGLSELLKGLCCRLVLGHGRDLIAGKHAVAHVPLVPLAPRRPGEAEGQRPDGAAVFDDRVGAVAVLTR